MIRFFGVYVSSAGDKYITTEFASKGSLLHLLQQEKEAFSFEDKIMM